MSTINLGTVREVWYSAIGGTKSSFLIRDDAFTKSGAVFGRTVRLGDPLNTGPGSGWRQTTWEGGNLQHDWNDKAMFWEGTADVWSHVGRIQMWPGWAHIHKDRTRKFDSYCFGSGNDGPAIGNTKLYIGERDYFYVASAPSGGYKAYKYAPDTNTMTQLATTPTSLGRGYTAICPATDDGSSSAYIYFGAGASMWLYQELTDTWFQDTNCPSSGVNYDSFVPFRDALYYLSGKKVQKRTPLAPYGVLGTHSTVKEHKAAYSLQGLALWNNRLWYGLNFQGNVAMLGTSDGVSAQTIIQFPEEFFISRIVAHYGSLFIFGGKPQAVAGSNSAPACIAQVWKYSGSSLSLLWESNDEDHTISTDGKPHVAVAAAAFGPLLVWGNAGFGGGSFNRAGLVCWDAEKDALLEGPHFPQDLLGWRSGMAVTGLHAFDNTLVASYHDFHNYEKNRVGFGSSAVDWPNGIAYIRFPNYMRDKQMRLNNTFLGHSVEASQNTDRMQYVLSSRYRGDESVQAEVKTWLAGKMTVRIKSKGARIKVYAVTDEDENYLVKTINYDATDTGWRTVTFPIKNPGSYYSYAVGGGQGFHLDAANSGKFLQSRIFQYRIELYNLSTESSSSTSTPEVDAVEFSWTVAPTKRLQYHIRHILQDGQARLTGVANPNATAQAQADTLEALWSAALPFRMWGPYASAVDPNTLNSTNCVEVVPQVESYQVQQYRVESGDSQVMQETGWTLIQNVTS